MIARFASLRSLTPCHVAAVALATGALAATAAFAAERLAKLPYENLTKGFLVYVPEGWVSVPPQPGETIRVVKFQSDAASKGRGYQKSELEVLILPRETVDVEERHAGGTKSTKYERNESAFIDWFKREYPNSKCVAKPFMRVPRRLKDTLQFETEFGGGGVRVVGMAFLLPTEDRSADVVLHYFCTDSEMKKLRPKVFLPSFASFKWDARLLERGRKADEKMTADAEAADSPVAKRALQLRQEMKDKPGWKVDISEHYVYVYNARDKVKDMVKREIELILPHYIRLFPPADPEITKKIAPIVRITSDMHIYRAYGAPPGSAGYWSSGQEELVFYDDGGSADLTLLVLRHEAFHQFIHYSCGRVAPHSWFNEGYGDYFSGCEVTPQGLIEQPATGRLGTIANAVRAEKHVPLKDIVRWSQADYYGGAGVPMGQNYAQGWSMIYFLNKGPRSRFVARKFKPEWKDILSVYFETLKKEWGDPTVGEDEPAGGGGQPDGGAKPGGENGDGKGDGAGGSPPGGAPGSPPGGAPGDGPGAAPQRRPRPMGYMERFMHAREKAVAAAFPDWTDADWDEFEAVWAEFVKKNCK